MSYYCTFFGCELYCPAHQRIMFFAGGEIWTYYIAYIHAWHVLFCKSYINKLLHVCRGWAIFDCSSAHISAHGELKEQHVWGTSCNSHAHISLRALRDFYSIVCLVVQWYFEVIGQPLIAPSAFRLGDAVNWIFPFSMATPILTTYYFAVSTNSSYIW